MNIQTHKLQKIGVVFIVVTVICYVVFDVHRITWVRNTKNSNPFVQGDSKFYTWMRENVNKEDIIGTTSPFFINHFTRNPVAVLPKNIANIVMYNKYTLEYHICYFAINESEKKFLPKNTLTTSYRSEDVIVLKNPKCKK